MTSNLDNLSLHQPYEGPGDIILGDGSSLKITYIGSSELPTASKSFSLSNVVCSFNKIEFDLRFPIL